MSEMWWRLSILILTGIAAIESVAPAKDERRKTFRALMVVVAFIAGLVAVMVNVPK